MDIIDLAQAHNEKLEEQRQQALLKRQPPETQGTQFCIECGKEIPPARRLAQPSACRCVLCQSAWEGGRRCA